MTPRRRLPWKAVLLLPVLIVPLAAAMFYGLGGGQGGSAQAATAGQGLNTELPGSLPGDGDPLDKLSIYELAERDSIERVQQKAADPFFNADKRLDAASASGLQPPPEQTPYPVMGAVATDPNEMRVHQKLAELQRQLQPPAEQAVATPSVAVPEEKSVAPVIEQQTNRAPDPEMAEINAMIEKVLDLQHPQRVTQRLQQISAEQRDKVFPVVANTDKPVGDLLLPALQADSLRNALADVNKGKAGFYEWPPASTGSFASNAVRAVVHETKTVVSGATIKLRLQQDLFIQGTRIPTGHFVYGKGNLVDDRYAITIRDIQYQDAVFPVSLEVFGLDGIAGIHIENAIGREVLRNGADAGIQDIQMTSLDPSLKAQAAVSAIETAKGFIGRKLKRTTVTLKSGEPVLLKDSSQ